MARFEADKGHGFTIGITDHTSVPFSRHLNALVP